MSELNVTAIAPSVPTETAHEPLRSVYTENFSASIDALGASLMVTTYQACQLVMVRADNGV